MIPAQILPKTLLIKVSLNNIAKIQLLHQKMPSMCGTSRIFMRKYIPSIRYYNQCIFEHKIGILQIQKDSNYQTPIFKIFDKENKLLEEFQSGYMEPDEILQKITSIDKIL